MSNSKVIHTLLRNNRKSLFFSSSFSANRLSLAAIDTQTPTFPNHHSSSSSHSVCGLVGNCWKSTSAFASSVTLRFINTTSSDENDDNDETDGEDGSDDGWEEEDEVEPEIGDGGDGGGIVLQNVPWGERTLSIAHEVLLQFGNDMKLYAFKTTPRGYIYVRLDKLSEKYGCPSIEEMEDYSRQYKKRLDEVGALGDIPDNLALEVSSPGAERLLKVPDDLDRFKELPMRVCYVEDVESKCPEKNGVFMLESVETESGNCVWKLADVKENRDFLGKGRPLSRKQKDWRLILPNAMFKGVSLYLEY